MLRTTFGIDERERERERYGWRKRSHPRRPATKIMSPFILIYWSYAVHSSFFPFLFQTTSCTPEIIVSLSTQLLLSDISRKLSSISHVSAPTTTATTTASIASTILAVILHPAALLPKGSLVPFSFLHFVLSRSRHRACNLGPNGSSHP